MLTLTLKDKEEMCRNLLMVERETACTVECCCCMGVGGAAVVYLGLHVWLNTNTRPTILLSTTALQQHGIIHTLLFLSLSLSLSIYLDYYHGPPQKRQLLTRRSEKILHPAPSTPRRQRELVEFLQTSLQSCMLGSGPLRSETMLREAIDEDWADARAFNRAAVSRCDCLVSFFSPAALRGWIK